MPFGFLLGFSGARTGEVCHLTHAYWSPARRGFIGLASRPPTSGSGGQKVAWDGPKSALLARYAPTSGAARFAVADW